MARQCCPFSSGNNAPTAALLCAVQDQPLLHCHRAGQQASLRSGRSGTQHMAPSAAPPRRGAPPRRRARRAALRAPLPGSQRLRGSVACLDCAAGHDLSGVVVAVRCDGAGLLRAAQTDARGGFDVAMPPSASASRCSAGVLGAAAEQLCAPRGHTVARVVPRGAPGATDSGSSAAAYALASRLAFFTRCGPETSGGATTTAARDRQGRRDAPLVPAPWPLPPATQTPVRPPPRGAGGYNSPPFGVGGLPIIYFFPFIPIIGIP